MIDLRDIHSLSDFQRKARAHIRRLKQTGRPAVLTVNGRAELVVQAAAAWQRQVAREEAPPASDLEPDPLIELYKKDVDRTLLRENLERSVDERLRALRSLQRLAKEARRAGQATAGGE
jgi:PHD/YefM family antitoxin component YafN of YafNO toxin-antitoxin module